MKKLHKILIPLMMSFVLVMGVFSNISFIAKAEEPSGPLAASPLDQT